MKGDILHTRIWQKVGVPESTVRHILRAHIDRIGLNSGATSVPSWRSLDATGILRGHPEIRKQVLELHQQGKTGGMSGGARVLPHP